jgi:hypothetical protein
MEIMESARLTAQRDIQQANYGNGLVLALPRHLLFDEEEFFRHYRDPIVDREREHILYATRRDGKRIVKLRPKK